MNEQQRKITVREQNKQMANAKLSAFAATDLKEIWEYVAENNPSAADKFIKELLQRFRFLAENPGVGKTRDEIFVNLRSFPVKNTLFSMFRPKKG